MSHNYITLVGTTPKIIALDNDCVEFQVSIRAPAGVTIELALENPNDSLVNANTSLVGPAPTWVAPPNAANANGVLHLTGTPYAAVRLTPTNGGNVTIVQQGIR